MILRRGWFGHYALNVKFSRTAMTLQLLKPLILHTFPHWFSFLRLLFAGRTDQKAGPGHNPSRVRGQLYDRVSSGIPADAGFRHYRFNHKHFGHLFRGLVVSIKFLASPNRENLDTPCWN